MDEVRRAVSFEAEQHFTALREIKKPLIKFSGFWVATNRMSWCSYYWVCLLFFFGSNDGHQFISQHFYCFLYVFFTQP